MNQQHHLIHSTALAQAAVSRETGHAPSFSVLQSCPQYDRLLLLANKTKGLTELQGAEGPMPSQHWLYFQFSSVSTRASHSKLHPEVQGYSLGVSMQCHPSPGEGV